MPFLDTLAPFRKKKEPADLDGRALLDEVRADIVDQDFIDRSMAEICGENNHSNDDLDDAAEVPPETLPYFPALPYVFVTYEPKRDWEAGKWKSKVAKKIKWDPAKPRKSAHKLDAAIHSGNKGVLPFALYNDSGTGRRKKRHKVPLDAKALYNALKYSYDEDDDACSKGAGIIEAAIEAYEKGTTSNAQEPVQKAQ